MPVTKTKKDVLQEFRKSELLAAARAVFGKKNFHDATIDDVANATAVWPQSRPEIEFGTVALTQRVDELSPDMRKIIFDPVPRVDGIDSAGDPLTELRSDIYLLSGRRRRAAAK